MDNLYKFRMLRTHELRNKQQRNPLHELTIDGSNKDSRVSTPDREGSRDERTCQTQTSKRNRRVREGVRRHGGEGCCTYPNDGNVLS